MTLYGIRVIQAKLKYMKSNHVLIHYVNTILEEEPRS